ncbi:acyltransferase family protein [Kineococcus gypseus]|uniref:acyltransferase family protein n=1 Tax=Kineococcus gypseus TaxID=1637102 RepID=UPI003D7D3E14
MTCTTTAPRPRELPTLTSLRAAAALFVVAYHLSRWGVLPWPADGVGVTGVTFFFVLSGFLLTWGYRGGLDARRFYARRLARVWPAHAVVWCAALLVPITAHPLTAGSAVTNLLLVQSWAPSLGYVFGANGVAWSLSCEVAFYAVFPFAVARMARWGTRTAVRVAAAAFLAETAVAVAVTVPGTPVWLALAGFSNPLLRLPEFLLGIAAALAVRSGWRPSWRALLAALALCLGGLAVLHDRPAPNVWTAPLYVVLIALAAARDCSPRRSPLAARPLVYAGKVSFALYLVHELVIINLRPLLGTGPLAAAGMVAASAAGAVLLHHAVELPAQALLVRRLPAARGGAPRPRRAPEEQVVREQPAVPGQRRRGRDAPLVVDLTTPAHRDVEEAPRA